MALRVWLPLNGTLENKGISDLVFSNTNTTNITIDNDGKIGKCYSRATKGNDGRIISDKNINLNNDISMCCWAYVSNCVGDTANGLVSAHSHADNTGIGITVKQVSMSDYRMSCNTGYGSGRTYNTYYGTTNIKNSWHHLCLTYSKLKAQLLLYVDGNLEYTLNNYNNSSRDDKIVIFDWSTTYDNTNYRPACKLNDVRIYDHCLSQKEVKEISKGLVLHYKLDGWSGGSGENLLSKYVTPGQQNPGTTSSAGRTNYYGDYGIIIPASENADTYFRLFTNTQLQQNVQYTISCEVSGLSSGTYYNFPLYSQSNTSMGVLKIDHNGVCSLTFTMTYATQTAMTADGKTVYLCFMDDSARTLASGQGAITIKNFKLEKGSVATAWSPDIEDLGIDTTKITDSSGYGNDGTITGMLTAESAVWPLWVSSPE